jgi:hypothetical protein
MRSDTWFKIVGLFTIVGATAALLVVPEVRRSLGLGLHGPTHTDSSQNHSEPSGKAPGPTQSTTAPSHAETRTVIVDPQRMWTDSNLQIKKGELITVEASGQVNACTIPEDGANKWVGPDGWGYNPQWNWGDTGKTTNWIYVLGKGSSLECLTGRIGRKGQPFRIGSHHKFTVPESGTLYLGVNHVISDWQGNITHGLDEMGLIWPSSAGTFTVKVTTE